MIFTETEIVMLKRIGSHYPEFRELIDRWRADELEVLAKAGETVFRTQQGRVHTLTELRQRLTP